MLPMNYFKNLSKQVYLNFNGILRRARIITAGNLTLSPIQQEALLWFLLHLTRAGPGEHQSWDWS